MKRFGLILMAAWAAVCAFAAAPNNSGVYYKNADGKKGAALKTALCGIIYNRTELTYNYLWTAYLTTDVRSDGKIWDMYSNVTNYEPGGAAQGANFSKEGDSYNREHSFPKSWFGGEVMPMYTDLHHLYPVDGYVNNRRNNYPFGETNGGTYMTANGFGKLGACTYAGYTKTVFEPADEYKGDFARTFFYMVTCYEEKLHDWVTNYGGTTEVDDVLDGSTYPGLTTWQLSMLMTWAQNDPVSEKEINRNNAVASIQGNRNPFIDYPGLEEYIWGTKTNDTFSYDNYVSPDGTQTNDETDETVADALTVAGWANYSTNAFSAANTDQTASSGTTGVSYAMQVYNGSTGAVRGNQSGAENFSCRNTTTYEGYYIKEVKLTVDDSGGTLDGSTNGRSLVYFGTEAFSVPPTGTPTTSDEYASGQTTLTWTNSNEDMKYFVLYNLKTAYTAKAAVVTVTWQKVPVLREPDTYAEATTVAYGTSFTLVNGTHFTTDGTVTLHSSNTDVATVDGLTVTPVAVGTCVINVTYSASEQYQAATSNFALTVTAPEGKTQVPDNTPFTETWNNTNGTGGNDEAWNGSIASSNVISDNEGWVFENAGGASKCIKVGIASKKGTATTPAFDRSGNVVVRFKAAAWDGNNEETLLILSLTGDGELDKTSVTLTKGEFNEYTINVIGASESTKLTFAGKNQSNSRFFLDDVVITAPFPSNEVTLNANGYATYCSEYPLDFSDYATAGYSAWIVTGVNENRITFMQVKGSVKGGTGLLLKGAPSATVTLNSTASTNEASGNLLYGTLAPTYVNAYEYYGLSGKNFVKVNAGTVKAGKALLSASLASTDGEVKSYSFDFGDQAAGLGKTGSDEGNRKMAHAAVYDLSGHRLQPSYIKKGIYIVNGRSVLLR